MKEQDKEMQMISKDERKQIISEIPEEGDFSYNNVFTKERVDKIIDRAFLYKKPPEGRCQKSAEILLGAPGSGKSYLANDRFKKLDQQTKSQTIYVSHDEGGAIFSIDEYQDGLIKNIPDYRHEHSPVSDETLDFRLKHHDDFRPLSQFIRNEVLKRALEDGYNLVVDITASNTGSIKMINNVLKPLGYDVHVVGSFAPIGASVSRVHERVRPVSDEEFISKRIGDPYKNEGALNMIAPLIAVADQFDYYYNPANNDSPELAFSFEEGELVFLDDDVVVEMKNDIIPDLEALEDYVTVLGYDKNADLGHLQGTYEQFENLMLQYQDDWEEKVAPTLTDVVCHI